MLPLRRNRVRARRLPLSVEALEDRTVLSTLIPVTDRRDLVYDPTRGLLDITTGSGSVQRYNVATQTLLTPLAVGTLLDGADITPDGSALYVADSRQLVVHRIDLATGAVTNLSYTPGIIESGSYDIAVGPAGKALFDGDSGGSAGEPLRQISLATNTVSTRTDSPGFGYVQRGSSIGRSADRSLFFFTEANASNGSIFFYNATTDTFSGSFDTNHFLDNALPAVSRDDKLLAMEDGRGLAIRDRNFAPVAFLTGVTGGVAFDPVSDVLYGVNPATGQVVAYDTGTWAVKYQLPIGEAAGSAAAFGNGVMTVSDDGRYLFLATPSGVRVFNLPSLTSTSFVVSGFPSPATAGVAGTFTVTAQDAQGHTLTNYTGTVHFTSTDVQAGLPADYTFTAADNGVHTFTATLKTAGPQTLTATETGSGSATGQVNVAVAPAAASSFAITSIPPSSTAGAAVGFTITARDAFGNTATGYAGTVHFSSSDAQAALPADYTFTAADAGTHTFAVTLKTAGAQTLTATDKANGALASQASVVVNPAAASALTVSGYSSPSTAGAAHGLTVTVRDAYGNTAAGYTGTVHFASSDAQSVLPGDYTFTSADVGVHVFSATLKTAGNQTVTAADKANSSLTSQATVTVSPAAASGLAVSGYPSSSTAGAAHGLTVTVRDTYGNTATGYTGTVHFSSTDGQAVLPADYTFTAADAGSHTFSAALVTPGAQTLTAADTGSSSVTAQASLTVSSPQTPPPAAPPAVEGDVSGLVVCSPGRLRRRGARYVQLVTIANVSGRVLAGPLALALDHLTRKVKLQSRSGLTLAYAPAGSPYQNVPVGSLAPGQSVTVQLIFTGASAGHAQYRWRVLAGPEAR